MKTRILNVQVATYVADECNRLAELLGVSMDALCAYFFALEVVHT